MLKFTGRERVLFALAERQIPDGVVECTGECIIDVVCFSDATDLPAAPGWRLLGQDDKPRFMEEERHNASTD